MCFKIMIDIINDVPFVTLTSKVLMILLSTLHSFNVTINDLTFFEMRWNWDSGGYASFCKVSIWSSTVNVLINNKR